MNDDLKKDIIKLKVLAEIIKDLMSFWNWFIYFSCILISILFILALIFH